MFRNACLLCAVLALAACQRESPPAPVAPPAPAAGPVGPAALPVRVEDVIERDPRYLVGISYPPDINRYPGLAAVLHDYAQSARVELMQAVEGLAQNKPAAPYDLSLPFSTLVESPQLVVIAADGSTYTGGAHGMPLIARFVWLPQQDKLLTARMLIPDQAAWAGISTYVREQLHASLSQRIDADELPAQDRTQIMRSSSRMIDEGTAPDPDNFSQFEPVLNADGRIRALRFVFPPYQVGPYSDGVQTVEVPVEVLMPKLAPEWRSLFAGG